MHRISRFLPPVAAALALMACCPAARPADTPRTHQFCDVFTDAERAKPYVQATSYGIPKDFVDGQWQGICAAADGKTYFGVSCHSTTRNAQFYRFDPKAGTVEHIIDLGRWCGETDTVGKVNTQGKIHSEMFEANGVIYCSSTSAHASFQHPYPGGHFLAYDIDSGEARDLGRYGPAGAGGLLTMHYEPVFGRLYALHQKDHTLVYYDLASGKIVEVGPAEVGKAQCRKLISDPRGNVYGSTTGGLIYRYDPRRDVLACLVNRIPYDPARPHPPGKVVDGRRQTPGWRQVTWDPETKWWYAVGYDEYLFRFRPPDDPKRHVGHIEPLVSMGRPGYLDRGPWASLGFCRMGRRLYYVSYPTWAKMAHLMSYDIDAGAVRHHGPIVCEAGRRVSEIHSLVAGPDDTLHAVAMVWSIEGEDPANPWANRGKWYFHARLLTIDPQTDFRNDTGEVLRQAKAD